MERITRDDPVRLGPYRLLGRLGTGGMGRVYLARSEGGRTVALKVVRAELAGQPEFRERFAREVDSARRVGGAWTAAVLDADTEAELPWVATRYIPGPSLHTVVARDFGPLPEDSVRVLANRLALALTAVHGAGLIHRDLKPSNVLVTIDGPRLIDFGIARALDVATGGLTRTGIVIGSPGFMSPEQVRGDELTPAGDVFCLGSVLAYASTGRPPFGSFDSGPHAQLFRVAEGEADLSGVPAALLGLVRDCLAKDPAARPTPDEVAARTQVGPSGPWLPSALLEQLGRHAAELLDLEGDPRTRLQAQPQLQPQDRIGDRTAPETPATPHPPPTPTPTSAPHPTPGFGTPAPHPLQPLQPPRPNRPRRARIIVASAVVAALVVTGAALLTVRPWEDDGGSNGASSERGAGGAGGASDVPREFLGTWEGEVKETGGTAGSAGEVYARIEVTEGVHPAPVVAFLSLGSQALCTGSSGYYSGGTFRETGLKQMTLGPARIERSIPEGSCIALGRQELTTRNDGDLDWRTEDGKYSARFRPVSAAHTQVPDAYVGTWTSADSDLASEKLRITIVRGKAGDTAARTTSEPQRGTHCEWTEVLASVSDEGLVFGPYELDATKSDGDCDATGPVHTYTHADEGGSGSGGALRLGFPTEEGATPLKLIPLPGN
ncbi:serine/threonine-protein kinase [Streptomyces apocyni]|uniref:serine/threonine-protein kinase n=1 Tax=Streptomyces apocyni TaxID=2654677 RepID=UPI0012E9B844|nr:serine/threonine-protein kinase [Streptomyces apocyni]